MLPWAVGKPSDESAVCACAEIFLVRDLHSFFKVFFFSELYEKINTINL